MWDLLYEKILIVETLVYANPCVIENLVITNPWNIHEKNISWKFVLYITICSV